jgi:hypothetical protein
MSFTPYERDNLTDSMVLIDAARKMLERVEIKNYLGLSKIIGCLEDSHETLTTLLSTSRFTREPGHGLAGGSL